MSSVGRLNTADQHHLGEKKQPGHTRHDTITCCPFGCLHSACHSERSRGIWLRTGATSDSVPDVSTPLRSARHDNRCSAAFTLIELLVVISIIALLMALLMPALSRARKQGKVIDCQARVRQWTLGYLMYASGSDGLDYGKVYTVSSFIADKSVLLCPLARKVRWKSWEEAAAGTGLPIPFGTKFCAWGSEDVGPKGSYGSNGWVWLPGPDNHIADSGPYGRNWYPYYYHNAGANVPLLVDCIIWGEIPSDTDKPPKQDDMFSWSSHMSFFCIDRHEGSVNGSFLDASVRRIGLKELWTLRWHRQFNTAGPWTKAGGVQPEDWPAWMRKFKEY